MIPEYISEFAVRLSRKTNLTKSQHSCIITCRDKIVSYGFNKVHKNFCICAEVDALNNLKCQKKLKGYFKANGIKSKNKFKYKMYIFRTGARGNFLISKPCQPCVDYISKFNISVVFYTV